MSLKAAFFRSIGELARSPAGRGELRRLVNEWRPVVHALEAGDKDRAREVMGDLEARYILRQALPDWEWRGE